MPLVKTQAELASSEAAFPGSLPSFCVLISSSEHQHQSSRPGSAHLAFYTHSQVAGIGTLTWAWGKGGPSNL